MTSGFHNLSIKAKLISVIILGFVVIALCMSIYGYTAIRAALVGDINREVQNTTENAHKEISFIFNEMVAKKLITEAQAREIINEQFSGRMKEVQMTLPSSTAVGELNHLFQRAGSFLAETTDCAQEQNDIFCENHGTRFRAGSARHLPDSRIQTSIEEPSRVMGLYHYYLSLSQLNRYPLEKDYTFRNIRDAHNTIIGPGVDGYVWAVTAFSPDWLIKDTEYPEDYTEDALRARIQKEYAGLKMEMSPAEYSRRFGATAEEQSRYISEYMRRENNPPLPIYDEFHPSLYNVNIDNGSNRLGQRIGREIAVRKNGLYEYDWRNPTDLDSRIKTVYMKLFEYQRPDGSTLKWVICTGAYQEEAYAPIKKLRTELTVIFAGMSIVFVAGFILLINYNMLRPLANLLRGVREVNRGNLDTRVNVPFRDEIGFLAESFNSMVESIKSAGRALQLKAEELERSEKKYRSLVENSGEIIFSMDMEGGILTMNRAITNYLGYSPGNLIGKDFTGLVSKQGPGEQALREALKEVTGGKKAQFRCHLISRNGEPFEMDVRLEKAEAETGHAIFGKAATVKEDELNRLIIQETQVYETGNFLTKIDMITERLTGPIQKFIDEDSVWNIRLCLREALINAIEHGNLEIDFETKTKALERGNYLEFIAQRQNLPEFRDRKIKIEYSLASHEVTYRLTEQGKGFDHRKMMKQQPDHRTQAKMEHGRGLMLLKETFDRIEFNEAGNEVLLVKYL